MYYHIELFHVARIALRRGLALVLDVIIATTLIVASQVDFVGYGLKPPIYGLAHNYLSGKQ